MPYVVVFKSRELEPRLVYKIGYLQEEGRILICLPFVSMMEYGARRKCGRDRDDVFVLFWKIKNIPKVPRSIRIRVENSNSNFFSFTTKNSLKECVEFVLKTRIQI